MHIYVYICIYGEVGRQKSLILLVYVPNARISWDQARPGN